MLFQFARTKVYKKNENCKRLRTFLQKNALFCLIFAKVVVPLHLMKSEISHKGVVKTIGKERVSVMIHQASACSSCKVSAHCSASESKEKIIEVMTPQSDKYKIGEEVLVTVSSDAAHRAVMVGFAFPLAVMVGVLLTVRIVTGDDVVAALSGISSVAVYYALVFLMRNHIESKVRFGISKTDNAI